MGQSLQRGRDPESFERVLRPEAEEAFGTLDDAAVAEEDAQAGAFGFEERGTDLEVERGGAPSDDLAAFVSEAPVGDEREQQRGCELRGKPEGPTR